MEKERGNMRRRRALKERGRKEIMIMNQKKKGEKKNEK